VKFDSEVIKVESNRDSSQLEVALSKKIERNKDGPQISVALPEMALIVAISDCDRQFQSNEAAEDVNFVSKITITITVTVKVKMFE
jgi:hypothetical protein